MKGNMRQFRVLAAGWRVWCADAPCASISGWLWCGAGCTPNMPAEFECTAAGITWPLCMLPLCLHSSGSRGGGSSRRTLESSCTLLAVHCVE
jgi:hypothetical protein